MPVSAILFKCMTKYCLYKQIKPLNSTSVPKLTPGYGSVSTGLNQINLII